MFDIGVLEIGLIAVVALLVIGPERLPAVARTLGYWFGKGRKFVTSVQQDFNRELVKTEELKKLLEEQSKIKDVHEIIEQSVDETKKTVSVAANLTPPVDVMPEEDNSSDQIQSQNEIKKKDQANKSHTAAEKSESS